MIQAMKRFWNNQKGVTLIELLAVVIILGVIAAIAAPSVITNFDDAKVSADAQTQAIIEDAAKRMVMDAAKEMPIDQIGITDGKNLKSVAIKNNGNTVAELIDYLDANFDDGTGTITTAEDKDKVFQLEIVEGKVTVSTVDN